MSFDPMGRVVGAPGNVLVDGVVDGVGVKLEADGEPVVSGAAIGMVASVFSGVGEDPGVPGDIMGAREEGVGVSEAGLEAGAAGVPVGLGRGTLPFSGEPMGSIGKTLLGVGAVMGARVGEPGDAGSAEGVGVKAVGFAVLGVEVGLGPGKLELGSVSGAPMGSVGLGERENGVGPAGKLPVSGEEMGSVGASLSGVGGPGVGAAGMGASGPVGVGLSNAPGDRPGLLIAGLGDRLGLGPRAGVGLGAGLRVGRLDWVVGAGVGIDGEANRMGLGDAEGGTRPQSQATQRVRSC